VRREAALWALCVAVVATAHAALWLVFATPRVATESDAGSPVVTLELSPSVTAPAPPPEDAQPDALTNPAPPPPGAQAEPQPLDPLAPPKPDPPQEAPPPLSADPSPPTTEQTPVTADPLPLSPAPAPDAPPPPPEDEESLDQVAPPAAQPPAVAPGAPPAPPPSAPSTASNRVSDVEAAPAKTPGSEEAVSPPALRHWQQDLIAQIERHKRFPTGAQGRTGVVQVAFSIDETGRLISVRVAISSGSAILDEAAVDLIRRAGPYPAPPAGLGASALSFVAPIRYLAAGAR
jgi:periplasmic protein TonB